MPARCLTVIFLIGKLTKVVLAELSGIAKTVLASNKKNSTEGNYSLILFDFSKLICEKQITQL